MRAMVSIGRIFPSNSILRNLNCHAKEDAKMHTA